MKDIQKKNKIIIILIFLLIVSLTNFFADKISAQLKNILIEQFFIIESDDRLMVHFISVGQGDAIAINLPNDEVLLIDTGPKESAVTFTNYIKEKVFNNRTDKTIDYLILTHADADHIGGAMRLLKNFDVENIYIPFLESESTTYLQLIEYIKSGDYDLMSDLSKSLVSDEYDIKIFGPFDSTDTNDTCPIIRLEYLNVSFLFTGDVSNDIESILLSDYSDDIDSDIIKIAHHGSKYSSSLEFLQAVSPEYAVISCGNNSYGHPTDVVLKNISEVGALAIRTDVAGNILFSVSSKNDFYLLTGEYNITGLVIDYRYFVLAFDLIMIVCICVLLLKKAKTHIH